MHKERLYKLLLEICAVPSTSESAGERDMAHKLTEIFMRLDYFKKNPQNIKAHKTPNDPHGRHFVTALLEGGIPSPDTVIVYGHYDVVGVDEFGELKKYAFDPEKYTNVLKESKITLDSEAQRDLDSGDWLFGRGVCDMKAGVATCIETVFTAAEDLKDFKGNILFLGVSDEEGNQSGMLAALTVLNQLKEQKGLNYRGCIVTEPYMPRENDMEARCIHVASVGKLLPLFYCVGRTGHVLDPLGALNPNLLVSKINEKLEQNVRFCDPAQDMQLSPAPMCLKQTDTKVEYNVQTPVAAYSYFNMMTYRTSPSEIMDGMLEIASSAFAEVIEGLEKRRAEFKGIGGVLGAKESFEPRVLTYTQLCTLCRSNIGDFDSRMERFMEELDRALDLREQTVRMIAHAHSMCPDRSPMIIVCYAPPYLPNSRLVPQQGEVMRVCESVIGFAQRELHERYIIDYTFNGISDMSYMNVSEGASEEGISPYMPLWGERYSVPVSLIASLAIPFVCLGTFGRDLHRYTERIHLPFTLEKAPRVMWHAAMEFLA